MSKMRFLPMSQEEVFVLGWDKLDVVLVTGDAYVDHPAFGAALLGRYLVSLGYKVGIIAQPDWRSKTDFQKLGSPRLFFGVTAGNLDSMVANYTAAKRPRKEDFYSPAKKAGLRPDRASIVYTNRLKESFPDIPIVLGGIEASMRRLAHYDYWSNSVRRSILFDAKADLLVYGMGEKQLASIAENLALGLGIESLYGLSGTAHIEKNPYLSRDTVVLSPFSEVTDKKQFNLAFKLFYEQLDPLKGQTVVQEQQDGWYMVINPPAKPLSSTELDYIYSLPFLRKAHPCYDAKGGVPALKTVQFSITTHRGCPGECYFCSLALHQGRIVQSRSEASIVKEAKTIAEDKEFRGTIDDVGGPSANLYLASCSLQNKRGACIKRHCLTPKICPHLELGQDNYLDLLEKIRNIKGINRVYIHSGIRFDVALKSNRFLRELCRHYVGGQLKVAPEHIASNVLKQMNKPDFRVYEKFCKEYTDICQQEGQTAYLIPYLISSHPGSTLNDAIELAIYLKKQGRYFEQVQDFIPLPLTVSAAMWYTGKNPFTDEVVHIPNEREKRMQRALLQFQDKRNWPLVRKALLLANREDLIGFCSQCLVPPEKKFNSKVGKKGKKR